MFRNMAHLCVGVRLNCQNLIQNDAANGDDATCSLIMKLRHLSQND